jgi:hypothetical protein
LCPQRDVARVDPRDPVLGCERVSRRARPKGGATPSLQTEPDPDAPALGWNIDARDSDTADLSWASAPGGTDHLEVYRDGRLIDEVPASTRSYRDYRLWQSTSYI